jgi:peptide/nickel transport system permease protein
MSRYILRRLLQAIPTLWVVSLVMFGIIHLAPGGPLAVYALSPNVDQAELDRLQQRLGLNDPLPIQYVHWLGAMVTGDWGLSYKFGRAVTDVLGERIGPTMLLVATSLVIALGLSVPLGIVTALYRGRIAQYAVNTMVMLGVSIPTFWLGMVVLLVLSVRIRLIPTGGMTGLDVTGLDLGDRLAHLLPPATVLATLHIASWSRYVRSSMLEVIGQDYVRTARSKGLAERSVMVRHALKNALLPLVTLVGLQGGNLIGGAMITEVVFAWPGVGRVLVESLSGRDYPVLMAAFMLISILVILGNLAADVCYGFIDPRIRLD